MSLLSTIAIIGVSEKRGFQVANQLAQKYPILLFDQETEQVLFLYDQIRRNNPSANVDLMACATEASWEADIIVVLGYCCTDIEIVEKIKRVSTGKIVILIKSDDKDAVSSSLIENGQQLLPHSKIVRLVFEATALDNEIKIQSDDEDSRAKVSAIFSAVGFNIIGND